KAKQIKARGCYQLAGLMTSQLTALSCTKLNPAVGSEKNAAFIPEVLLSSDSPPVTANVQLLSTLRRYLPTLRCARRLRFYKSPGVSLPLKIFSLSKFVSQPWAQEPSLWRLFVSSLSCIWRCARKSSTNRSTQKSAPKSFKRLRRTSHSTRYTEST